MGQLLLEMEYIMEIGSFCGVGHPGMSCSEVLKADWRDLEYPDQLKRYPPTDLEEATRPLQPGEYCASCGYAYGVCRCFG